MKIYCQPPVFTFESHDVIRKIAEGKDGEELVNKMNHQAITAIRTQIQVFRLKINHNKEFVNFTFASRSGCPAV